MNVKSIIKTKSFIELVDLIHYGINYQKDNRRECCASYLDGVIECTAHIAACVLVQRFGFDCMGTMEVIDSLKLNTFPTKSTIKINLIKLFEARAEAEEY